MPSVYSNNGPSYFSLVEFTCENFTALFLHGEQYESYLSSWFSVFVYKKALTISRLTQGPSFMAGAF